MKAKLEAVVARFKGNAIASEGINNHYTSVQLYVSKVDLDDETIKVLQNTKYVSEGKNGFNLGENKAKDYQEFYGENLTVSIETFDVEI